jgi:predicted Zn-dependent peptidase
MPSLPIPRFILALGLVIPAAAGGKGLEDLGEQVQEYTLPNGLTFLVLERPEAPVFSFQTYVDAGGVDEVQGITGIAHMFEHMAFKGTETVGATDITAERAAMARVDEAVAALAQERNKGNQADSARVRELEEAFRDAQSKAKEFVVQNEFSKLVEEHGAVGLNASTSLDWTTYYYSLPSNRLELWARLEGDRLTNPVLREFYSERDVVYEERRFQESSPIGRLFLDWINVSYQTHPYGRAIIGHAADLKAITREDAWDFYRKHYVGSNMTIAVVGDVKFKDVKKFADKYFSGVAAGEDPPDVRTAEPRHESEIRVIREDDAQPFVLMGYHIPGRRDPDWCAVELLGAILGDGRSSRLYRRLVKEDKVAAQAGAGAGLIADKYPSLLLVQALVAADATVEQVESAVDEEVARLVREGPTPEELDKVKTMNQAAFIRNLRSNSGLAGELAAYDQKLGDWRKLFDYQGEIAAVTVEDIRRVAAEYLRWDNRVVGILRKPKPTASEGGAS